MLSPIFRVLYLVYRIISGGRYWGRRRFTRAKAAGDLPASASPANLARYAATVIQGICVQGASGASRRELRRVADLALRAWPT